MDKATEKKLAGFARIIRKKFPGARLILFGSRARGDNLVYSDYDLIVVSKGFSGSKLFERMSRISELWELKEGLDVLPFTPEEFERKSREIPLRQMLEKAKEI